jgi:hypothetical protein
MDELERILPSEIVRRAGRAGAELVLSCNDARQAILFAAIHRIAILGVEVFSVANAGLIVEHYSGYEFAPEAEWGEFVRLNNDAASAYLAGQPADQDYGFILTAVSEVESSQLTNPRAAIRCVLPRD